jgi:hypothetical protein
MIKCKALVIVFNCKGEVMNLAIDRETKEAIEFGAKEFKISEAEFLKGAVIDKLSEVDSFYSPKNIAELERRAKDMEEGRNIVRHDIIEV